MKVSRIDVYCDDKSHDSPPELRTFRLPSIGLSAWVTAPTFQPEHLRDNNPISEMMTQDEVRDGRGERRRYKLACPCGIVVELRDESLQPILTKLATNGVSRIGAKRLEQLVST